MAQRIDKIDDPPKNKGHDFLNDKKWFLIIEGYGESRNFIYHLYIGLIYGFFLFLLSLSVYGGYQVTPNKKLIIGCLHLFLNSSFTMSGLTVRHLTDKYLQRSREIILSGFYRYEEEELDYEIIKMEKNVVREVQMRSKQFISVFLVAGTSNLIFFPISQYFFLTDEQYEASVDVMNPYFPNLLHLPFSTRTAYGFTFGFIINILILFYIYGIAVSMMEVYVSTLVQLRVQLQILNYSIKNISNRAFQMYLRRHGSTDASRNVLYDNIEFQNCLYKCLRSNIKHHQILLRFYKEIKLYNGSCLLIAVVAASTIFASVFYLILKGPPINLMINFIVTLLAEQTYVFYTCFFAEQILDESRNLYYSIYSTPWFYCNKSFNSVLTMFMCSTKQPLQVKTVFLNVTASIERYGDFILAMYKIVNLLRQSDVD